MQAERQHHDGQGCRTRARWIVRPALDSDLAGVARIHVAAWRAAYRGLLTDDYLDRLDDAPRETFWRAFLQRSQGALCVAFDAGPAAADARTLLDDATASRPVAGWLSYGRTRDAGQPPQTAELYAFYVDPLRWASGAGQALWRAASADLAAQGFERVDVWVLAGNARGLRFYRRIGMAIADGVQRHVTVGGRSVPEVRLTCALRAAPAVPPVA